MTRAERAEAALRLRADGKTGKEIAAALGVSRSYAAALYNDPDGAKDKKRKAGYGGTCIDCGARTDGSMGRDLAPKRCFGCRKAWEASDEGRAAHTIWTQRRIIAAIQDWAEIHGEPPAAPDWNPYGARTKLGDEERAARFDRERPRWPHFTTVVQRFGSWNTAIEQAGFEPREPTGAGGNIYRRRDVRERAAA